MSIVIIGKEVPKQFEEVAGSIHLGNGVWIFNCKLKEANSKHNSPKQNLSKKDLGDNNFGCQTQSPVASDTIHKNCEPINFEKEAKNHPDIRTCKNGECIICGWRDCPHHEPLHYHHDGCPACMYDEDIDISDQKCKENAPNQSQQKGAISEKREFPTQNSLVETPRHADNIHTQIKKEIEKDYE